MSNSETSYQMKLIVTPKDIKCRATFRFGEWMINNTDLGNRLNANGSIKLYLLGYDGNAEDKAIEWRFDYPLQKLTEKNLGTWLVPANTKGDYFFLFEEAEVETAILNLAEEIWSKTKKSPNIEVVRLDEEKVIRIYDFWFPFSGHGPIIESQPIFL